VIVDAGGSNLTLTPLYARAPKGVRAYGHVPRNTDKNTTLIAALSLAGMGAALILDGATDPAACAVYIEQVLGPTLVPGTSVVLEAPTRVSGCSTVSKHGGVKSGISQPTPPMCPRSRKPLPSSRTTCGAPRHGHARHWNRHLPKPWTRLAPKMPLATLRSVATVATELNDCVHRCRREQSGR
jgi:hypothetical protein